VVIKAPEDHTTVVIELFRRRVMLRSVSAFLFISALSAAAQDSTGNAAMDNAIRSFGKHRNPIASISGILPERQAPPTATCSVPVIKMKIPDDRSFTMKILEPPDINDPIMPKAKVPAPACPSSDR
jgi:hypothetical protein